MRVLTIAYFTTAVLMFGIIGCSSSPGEQQETLDPVRPTTSLVERGQPLYQQNCAGCHGDADTPPPLPFVPSHTDEGHTWHHPDRNLVDWILDGTGQQSAMPAYRGKLSEAEVRSVLAYIKSFWSDDILARQLDASEAYEEFLTGGD